MTHEFLDTTLLQEKRPVTYRLLARRSAIHVNTAKQILFNYANEHRNQVYPTYCLMGILNQPSESGVSEHTIQLVKGGDLEQAKQAYRTLSSMHVYSLSPYEPNDITVIMAAHADLPQLTIQERQKNGFLVYEDLHVADHVMTESRLSPVPKKPTEPINTAKPSPKRDATQTFGKPTDSSNKKPFSTIKKTSTPAQSSKASKAAPKKGPIARKEVKKEEPKPEKPQLTQVDADAFWGDDDDDDEFMAEAAQLAEPTTVEEEQGEDDTMDIDEEPAQKPREPTPQPEEPQEPLPPGKIRKKVLKTVTYPDEKGMMVTDRRYEWEEVDAPQEPASPASAASARPKPAFKPAPAKGSKKKQSANQSSIMQFMVQKKK
ncbi:DNA polymerase subunit Cdc27-domain-containing protein [Syncephalastrum racemosum]|uniref:DNA polymerase delta subunit 3 n=1 Tax=Syncephalastrum racemosum TaxID=13706 RepID=A0A1X2H9Y8_SYNRA|nr:DNA polymerase subunit Cdc27-domain-containing protein [Syncephalastrum racemosum]